MKTVWVVYLQENAVWKMVLTSEENAKLWKNSLIFYTFSEAETALKNLNN